MTIIRNSKTSRQGFSGFIVKTFTASAKKQSSKLDRWLSKDWWKGLSAITAILALIVTIQMNSYRFADPDLQTGISEPLNVSNKLRPSFVDVHNNNQPLSTSETNLTGKWLSTGKIYAPTSNSVVGPQFYARGTINLQGNEKAWLVIRKGILIWPKQGAITHSGNWGRMIHEGGPSGALNLGLIVVNTDNTEIEEWFKRSKHLSGEFSGMVLANKAYSLYETSLTLMR